MNEPSLRYFVGLDIGTTAVRCIVGQLGEDSTTPSVVALSEIPCTGIHKGNVAHIDEVAQAITDAVSEAERTSGSEIRNATININGSHVQGVSSKGVIAITNQNHEINDSDRMRVEEAATIVQLPPNKDIIQVFAKNYRIDSQDNIKNPVGMHGVRLEVDTHIVLASTPSLKSLDLAMEKANVGIAHRTVGSLAAAEAVLDRKQKESGTVVIDIGASTTNLVVVEEGEIEHIGVIPIGGINFTNDLAIGLKTELDIAEQVKLKFASLEPETESAAVLNRGGQEYFFDRSLMRVVVSSRMEELLELVDKELKKVHKSGRLPGGAVFVGGGSKMPGLVEFAKEQLSLPAKIGSLKHIEKIVDGLDDQRLAAPVGLMMMDMLLGPAVGGHQTSEPGLLNNMFVSVSGLFKKARKNK